MDDFSHARQLIYNEASDSEKVELRRKWLNEPLVAGTTRRGVEQISKGANTVNTFADTFFIELIDDEREALESAAQRAKAATEETRATRLKSDEKELSRKFSKLISGNIARVLNGELLFQLPNSEYFYSVSLDNGQFLLSVDNTPVERFAGAGDEIKTLAKLLAKNPQPKPAITPAAEPTPEQRLRSTIKNFVAAFEDLRKV
jgi:hypothetical protein